MSKSLELGEEKEVRLDSGKIRYRQRGSGPTIVFVHGLLVNGDLWRKVVPLLAGEFRCITPDWPLGSHDIPFDDGVKQTTRRAAGIIRRFLDALDLDDATLVGNDTGGGLCQILVAARVPGLVWVLLQSMRVPPLRRLPIAFGWLTKRQIPDEIVMDSYLRPYLENSGVRRDTLNLVKDISPKHMRRAAERLPQFRKPVLIAWAKEGRIFPAADAYRLSETFPNAKLELVEDSYTFVPEDQPEKLAHLVAKFICESAPVGAESS